MLLLSVWCTCIITDILQSFNTFTFQCQYVGITIRAANQTPRKKRTVGVWVPFQYRFCGVYPCNKLPKHAILIIARYSFPFLIATNGKSFVFIHGKTTKKGIRKMRIPFSRNILYFNPMPLVVTYSLVRFALQVLQ